MFNPLPFYNKVLKTWLRLWGKQALSGAGLVINSYAHLCHILRLFHDLCQKKVDI